MCDGADKGDAPGPQVKQNEWGTEPVEKKHTRDEENDGTDNTDAQIVKLGFWTNLPKIPKGRKTQSRHRCSRHHATPAS